MGKNIKSYATTQVHSPGKGREALRQKVQIFRLNRVRLNRTYYSLLNFTSKIFQNCSKIWSFGQNSSKLSKIHSIRSYIPQITQNSHILLTYSTLCFRHSHRQRTLWNSSELCKFRATRPHSPQITRNSHHLLTLYITFQMPDQWQRTP